MKASKDQLKNLDCLALAWENLPNFVWHHTITSGHLRKSARAEITPDLGLEEHVASIIAKRAAIPGFSGTFARGEIFGSTLAVEVFVKGRSVVSFVVAPLNDGNSLKAFEWAVARDASGTMPAEPKAPYCSAAISADAFSALFELSWIADYERCIAWTWLALRSLAVN